jgi:GTP-binding protein
VERTSLLVHVLDMAPELSAGEGADPVENHATIERELAAHDERLARLPRVLALSKADLVSPERVAEAVAEWEQRLGEEVPVIATSSATSAGIERLSNQLLRSAAVRGEHVPADREVSELDGATAPAGPAASEGEELAEFMIFRPAARTGFQVERLGPGSFAVRGRGIELLLGRYDVSNEEALAYVEERLRRIGVMRALQAEGFQAGDQLEIGGVSLKVDPK